MTKGQRHDETKHGQKETLGILKVRITDDLSGVGLPPKIIN